MLSMSKFPSSDADLKIAYISPGHGARGQQHWLIDEDVKDMKCFCGFTDPGKNKQKKKPSNYENKLDEVEAVVDKLKEIEALGWVPWRKKRMWTPHTNGETWIIRWST